MSTQVLITGGAGFIGSHLADELLAAGYAVRALDNLSPQVHGPEARRPSYLAEDVELVVGDVRDPAAVRRALRGVDAVFHFAAVVGVGQSMYEVVRYTEENNVGTATLMEALIARPVTRLVVASSMSIYGEGLYVDSAGAEAQIVERTREQLRRADWEVCDRDGRPVSPVPTPESKRPSLSSVYALSKFDQEQMAMILGRAYGIPTVAMRFFNTYGPRQALSNPYTGVLAIFASRLLNGRSPLINEDGLQRRDFVHVRDVARACRLALETPTAAGRVFNVGSGVHYSVSEVAAKLAVALGSSVSAQITGQYRAGDIRHCFPDVGLAQTVLGYRPSVSLEDGLKGLAAWLRDQQASDRVESARAELQQRGLAL